MQRFGVCVRVDSHGLQSERLTAVHDAAGDLTAIGDQHFFNEQPRSIDAVQLFDQDPNSRGPIFSLSSLSLTRRSIVPTTEAQGVAAWILGPSQAKPEHDSMGKTKSPRHNQRIRQFRYGLIA